MTYFKNLNLADFWHESEYATVSYVSASVTNELITAIENELGYNITYLAPDFATFIMGLRDDHPNS